MDTGALWLGFPRAKISISSEFSLTLSTREKTQILRLFLDRGSPSLSWVAEILCPELAPSELNTLIGGPFWFPLLVCSPAARSMFVFVDVLREEKNGIQGPGRRVHWGPSARS